MAGWLGSRLHYRSLQGDPHWESADVSWTVTHVPTKGYMTDFNVWAHVLCGGNDDCLDSDHWISYKGSGGFKVRYPWSLKGLNMAMGLKLETVCVDCTEPGSDKSDARTRWALCSKSKDMCHFK